MDWPILIFVLYELRKDIFKTIIKVLVLLYFWLPDFLRFLRAIGEYACYEL